VAIPYAIPEPFLGAEPYCRERLLTSQWDEIRHASSSLVSNLFECLVGRILDLGANQWVVGKQENSEHG